MLEFLDAYNKTNKETKTNRNAKQGPCTRIRTQGTEYKHHDFIFLAYGFSAK